MPGATAARPLRADAARNRGAILLAARRAFETDGVYTALDGIAVSAGVGNATLYRNFPTREDLLAAVMEDGIAAQLARGDELAATLSPREALAEWLFDVTWQLRIWNDLPTCLVSASQSESPLRTAFAQLVGRTSELIATARAAGDVLESIDPAETVELITGLSWTIDRFGKDAEAARRLVETATAGLFVASR